MSNKIVDAARLCRAFAAKAWARTPETGHIPCITFDGGGVSNRGKDVSIGLIDGSIDPNCPDLAGARIALRDFVGSPDVSPDTIIHGTRMAALLVGQGRQHMLGVAPDARLWAARVVGPGDVATPARIAAAIEWLLAEGIRMIAMPIGSELDSVIVGNAVERGARAGAHFLAASGCGAGPVLFPARHPLVTAVGPADAEGRILPDARRVPRLDLLAPGFQNNSLGVDDSVGTSSGSSIACVLAAGARALQTS